MFAVISRFLLLPALVLTVPSSLLVAQTPPDKAATMPQILQFGLGPGGTGLPNDGTEYCGPTSMTMNIGWAGLAGHGRLAPTTAAEQTQDFFLNLDRTLGGLSQADGFGGTTVSGLMQGVELYLKMKGYSGHYTASTAGVWGPTGNGDGTTGVTTPTLADLTSLANSTATDLHFGSFLVGWYDPTGSNWDREGGHFLAVVSTSGSNTVVINNPYPNEGMPIQQTILLSDVPSGTDGNSGGPPNYNLGGYLNASEGMQYPIGGTMPSGYYTPVIEQWLEFTLPIAPPAVATWHLEQGINALSIGLGHQEVLAPLADSTSGASQFSFSGGGTLTFTQQATHTGGTSVSGATLASTVNTGTPFGAGPLTLTSGSLVLQPEGSGIAVSLTNGAHLMSLYGASSLHLHLDDQASLTFTVGGFFRSGDGSLVIATHSSSQTATLGENVKFLAANTAPSVTGGMVSPAYIGQDDSRGFFLTYSASDGFLAAATVSGDINTLAGTPVYKTAGDQFLTGTANVAAIDIDAVVSGDAGSTLNVGLAGLEGAGILFNGGTLAVQNVSLGGQTGFVYTGSQGGTLSSVVTGSGANGVNFFGPGTLTISGTVAVTGPARVQGTTVLAEPGAITVGSLLIDTGATLTQQGAIGATGGPVPVTVKGTRLGSGDITGNVTVDVGGTFSGAGDVTGDTVVFGTLSQLVDPTNPSDVLTFNGSVTFEDEGFYYYNLASIEELGLNDFFQVNGELIFESGAEFGILFNAVDDPSTGNSFWNINQTFLVASATQVVDFDNLSLNALDYANGYFWIGHDEGEINLHWHAVPEPGTAMLLVLAGFLVAQQNRRRARSARPRSASLGNALSGHEAIKGGMPGWLPN